MNPSVRQNHSGGDRNPIEEWTLTFVKGLLGGFVAADLRFLGHARALVRGLIDIGLRRARVRQDAISMARINHIHVLVIIILVASLLAWVLWVMRFPHVGGLGRGACMTIIVSSIGPLRLRRAFKMWLLRRFLANEEFNSISVGLRDILPQFLAHNLRIEATMALKPVAKLADALEGVSVHASVVVALLLGRR